MDWLKTVTELTDPMVARQAIEDAEVLEGLDFDLPCSSGIHESGAWGHDGGPATHFVYGKCACGGIALCLGAVTVMLRLGSECTRCGAIANPAEMRFEPIGKWA